MTPPGGLSGGTLAARALGLTRVVAGLGMLWGAPLVVWTVDGRPPTRVGVRGVRVLAARELVQGTLSALRPDRTTTRLGTVVDAVHLASMISLAAVNERYRRLAMTAALEAALETGLEAGVAHGMRDTVPAQAPDA